MIKRASRDRFLTFLISSLVVVYLLLSANSSYAAIVRGQLQRGAYPVPYVTVTLYSQANGRSAPSLTALDGMYHLYNVPPGQYLLEIWIGGPKPIVYKISVHEPYTDISPIRIQ